MKPVTQLKSIALATLLAACSHSAQAAAVSIRPGQMTGWQIAIKSSADPGAIQPSAEFRSDLTDPQVGAFHASTGSGRTDPGQLWLGTDRYNSVYLRDITKLEYRCHTFYGGDLPSYVVSEPIQLQLAIKSSSTYYRYLMYRPWGLGKPAGRDPADHTPFDVWQTFDCINAGIWYGPISSNWTGTWSQLLAKYPNAYLATPCGGAGFNWPVYTTCSGSNTFVTGTGCSLNFEVGARDDTSSYFTSWYRESVNFRGLLDYFTIGVKDANGDVAETTWDFEPGPSAMAVGITSRAASDPIVISAKNRFRFVAFGQLAGFAKSDHSEFYLNDGSGPLIRVVAPGNSLPYYAYVRAQGTLDNTTTPVTLISSAEDVTEAPVGTSASTGPSMIVDPVFYYYLDRSAESIVDELNGNGYCDVRLVCINESGINNSLVKQFAGSGVKVWMMTFANGTYSTTDLPAGWESWKMVLRQPYAGFTYLCPNNPNYRAWKKTQVTNALLAHPFYGIDFAEPYFPGTYGPSSNYYGCMCSYCADAFRAMFPGVEGPPDFEDPASPHYYKTDTSLYLKWIDFRVASVNGFLDYLINGAGGVRERCPKVRIATWTLGLDTSNQIAKLREYYGFDAAAMVQLIRPDAHMIQTDWPDWIKADLSSNYVLAYKPVADSIRAVSPQTPIILQTDVGSQTQMRRTRSWLADLEQNARRIGIRSVTSYEYYLGKYIYTEPPNPVSATWDAGKIKIVFQKRLDPTSATNLANYQVSSGTISFASLDGSTVRLTVTGVPKHAVITVDNISDDEPRRYYHDYPACVMPQPVQITIQ